MELEKQVIALQKEIADLKKAHTDRDKKIGALESSHAATTKELESLKASYDKLAAEKPQVKTSLKTKPESKAKIEVPTDTVKLVIAGKKEDVQFTVPSVHIPGKGIMLASEALKDSQVMEILGKTFKKGKSPFLKIVY